MTQNKLTPEIKALLGTMPDGAIAKMFGIARSTVAGYRKELGIAQYNPPPPPEALECPKCGHVGAVHSTKQFWRCRKCRHQFSETGRKRGGQPLGDRPMTPYERFLRSKTKKDSLSI